MQQERNMCKQARRITTYAMITAVILVASISIAPNLRIQLLANNNKLAFAQSQLIGRTSGLILQVQITLT
jgi:hypothetical protein